MAVRKTILVSFCALFAAQLICKIYISSLEFRILWCWVGPAINNVLIIKSYLILLVLLIPKKPFYIYLSEFYKSIGGDIAIKFKYLFDIKVWRESIWSVNCKAVLSVYFFIFLSFKTKDTLKINFSMALLICSWEEMQSRVYIHWKTNKYIVSSFS